MTFHYFARGRLVLRELGSKKMDRARGMRHKRPALRDFLFSSDTIDTARTIHVQKRILCGASEKEVR